MSVTLRRPKGRTCERCGRVEQWNDQVDSWEITDDAAGSVYCIHEWDINGQFVPYDSDE
ncbi:HEWD family protein [Halohasta salina]|uniref:HEWD family protein n=1 Tax=Halohasta salina TaxID=2961621 RepID=UPI0020A5B2B6|nr:HEWD family protein [Halohasta salina]